MNLKETFGVQAGGTHFRGGSAYYDVAAVAAFPYLDLAFFTDLGGLHVVQ